MSEYLTVKQAAEQLGVCSRTVRRRVADGSLPAVRVGPHLVRVRADDIVRLVRPIPSASYDPRGAA